MTVTETTPITIPILIEMGFGTIDMDHCKDIQGDSAVLELNHPNMNISNFTLCQYGDNFRQTAATGHKGSWQFIDVGFQALDTMGDLHHRLFSLYGVTIF